MTMTEDDLKAIEVRVRAWRSKTGLGLCEIIQKDTLALIAEVRRLRALTSTQK